MEADGQIQAYSDHSHLSAVSSDAKLVGEPHAVDERIFGNSESNTKSHHSGSFKKYGTVSWHNNRILYENCGLD